MQKKAVIVLGAGMPIAWGGPLTSKITNELLKCEEFLTKDNQSLAKYIQNHLAKYHNCSNDQIHFEYIINSLETISDYLHSEVSKGNSPQFTGSAPAWFSLSEAYSAFENFRFEPIQELGVGFLLNLAKPFDTAEQTPNHNYKSIYIRKVIEHYLTIIRRCIGTYDNIDQIKQNEKENTELVNFYHNLKELGYTVRFYTTNYDDLVPNIYSLMNTTKLFQGFTEDYSGRLFPNINKILTEDHFDCHYNLHGSIYWQTGTNEMFDSSFWYTPGMPISYPISHAEYTNPTEHTSIYNIITGFNKLQKVSIEPLKAFFTTLSNDCINADLIVTIGYSYSDIHINRSLEYGTKHGHAKFLHITWSSNFFGSQEYINMQGRTIKGGIENYSTIKDACIITNDNKAIIYTKGFGDFLNKKDWKKILEQLKL
ncbi:MAG: hypothetical protein ACK50A_08585 [Sphingobacteriaceae bacterium]